MPTTAPVQLLLGHTVHQRHTPFSHRFRYKLSLIDIDIDRLSAASDVSRWFSINTPNLFSFSSSDHGTGNLRAWAEAQFNRVGVNLAGGQIRLVTFPRHLFYKFAPLSIWLGYGEEAQLRGVIYEVRNTFGETHAYVAATPESTLHRHFAEKSFHVSPFFDLTGRYQFTLKITDSRFHLIIASQETNKQTHVATISANARPMTNATLLWLTITRPFNSLGVTVAIHWQALRLWLKGATYRPKPPAPDTPATTARLGRPSKDERRSP